jgi:hypothetical protein
MASSDSLEYQDNDLVELTRVQPFEAEVIAARLRAAGIEVTLGAGSVYESVSFADGVPVYVAGNEEPQALALLQSRDDRD